MYHVCTVLHFTFQVQPCQHLFTAFELTAFTARSDTAELADDEQQGQIGKSGSVAVDLHPQAISSPQPHPYHLPQSCYAAQVKVSRWGCMSGSLTVIEALLRDELPPTPYTANVFIIGALTRITSQLTEDRHQTSTLNICISLAATIRKVMQCLTLSRDTPARLDAVNTYHCNGNLAIALADILHRVGQESTDVAGVGDAANNGSKDDGGGSSITCSSSRSSVDGGSCRHVEGGSSSKRMQLGEGQRVGVLSSKTIDGLLLNQLASIMVATYVQERTKVIRSADWDSKTLPPETIPNLLITAAAIRVGMTEAEAENMLPPSNGGCIDTDKEMAQDRSVAEIWEKHAVQHFHGRMLPGCCHLGCMQLCGVSESSLPTQLCGGCRRARYCSIECQREAWVAGGHMLVCGSGEG